MPGYIILALVVGVVLGILITELLSRTKKVPTTVAPQALLARINDYFKPHRFEELVTIHRVFPSRVKADLQLSLEQALKADGVAVEYFSGLSVDFSLEGIELSGVMATDSHQLKSSPPKYRDVDVGAEAPVRCLTNGIWLATRNSKKFAVLLAPETKHLSDTGIRVEIALPQGIKYESIGTELFKQIEDGIARAGSYRGKVLSLEEADSYSGYARGINVHRVRPVRRADLILPERTLNLLDRNILHFVEQREKLVALGMSARKGLLFFGPPGTGKTHTIHYLIDTLKDHTFFLISAHQQKLIAEYLTLARLLQPSVIVLEDADLIARKRERMNTDDQALLNTLLNEMDGLQPDAQIIFVLTTNRPEVLEEALAARPGRIDQGVEFPVPDDECRERLIRLYAGKTTIPDALVDTMVERTRRVSAAFIKELVRRSVQYALQRKQEGGISELDVENALQELLHSNSINLKLVGGHFGSS